MFCDFRTPLLSTPILILKFPTSDQQCSGSTTTRSVFVYRCVCVWLSEYSLFICPADSQRRILSSSHERRVVPVARPIHKTDLRPPKETLLIIFSVVAGFTQIFRHSLQSTQIRAEGSLHHGTGSRILPRTRRHHETWGRGFGRLRGGDGTVATDGARSSASLLADASPASHGHAESTQNLPYAPVQQVSLFHCFKAFVFKMETQFDGTCCNAGVFLSEAIVKSRV